MTIAVGVVGKSWWMNAMYLPALQNHPDARVVAIYEGDGKRERTMAALKADRNYFGLYTDSKQFLHVKALFCT